MSADDEMGFCNSCGEEAELDSECCDDGEVWPYDYPAATQPATDNPPTKESK